MKTPVKIVLILSLTLLPVAGVAVYGYIKSTQDTDTKGAPANGQYKEIDWRVLRGLNIDTGEKPADLAALNDQYIKIPGFVVPLDDDAAGLSEFLLVPSPQACIHVPPPPANQMVMVRMKGDKAPQRSWGPVWLKGRLSIANQESNFGKVSYMLYADDAEPYRMPDEN
jgi:hypothetical protein